MARKAINVEDYVIAGCAGCGAWPMRDDGSETLGEYNYLGSCAKCRRRICLVCTEQGHAGCTP